MVKRSKKFIFYIRTIFSVWHKDTVADYKMDLQNIELYHIFTHLSHHEQNILPSRLGPQNTLISSNECPGYDTKHYDGEAPVILELLRMQSTPLLPSLLGPLWSGVVAPGRVLSIGQIELNSVITLKGIVWNRTVSDIQTVYLSKLNC